eukprot:TRINITY_DN5064_c0_g1_i1.p1 TRINITY_DN5064_c0_g1~~TRINITY_DN5064_c0_g1_i1.p1  ORF type:complete len:439 (+),score=115.13 TRINITY_DN5064_c0_g1_i1:83-1399(+)
MSAGLSLISGRPIISRSFRVIDKISFKNVNIRSVSTVQNNSRITCRLNQFVANKNSKNTVLHDANMGKIWSVKWNISSQTRLIHPFSPILKSHYASQSQGDEENKGFMAKIRKYFDKPKVIPEDEDEDVKESRQSLQEYFRIQTDKWKRQLRERNRDVPIKERLKNLWKMAHDLGTKVWEGFKMLYYNTKEANELRRRLRNKEELTRMEHQFLRRNRQDLINMVPFFFVWRVPILGDFILPFFIAKYPELLPSTFRLMKALTPDHRERIATLKQGAYLKSVTGEDNSFVSAVSNVATALRVRQGHGFNPLEIAKHKQLLVDSFGDVSVLDRPRIAALLVRLGVGIRAPAFMLRKRLAKHIDYLVQDDALIHKEGVESLVRGDLTRAVMERGMNVAGRSIDQLRSQLYHWLNLNLDAKTMTALLIYAHTHEVQEFYFEE